jgi:hypothetical protein
VLFFASFTRTVNEELPADVGVPEMTPDDAVRFKPAGRVPAEMLQVYGIVPPVAPSVAEYALPTVPPGNDVVVTEGGCELAAAIVKLKDCVAVCGVGEVESVTIAVKVN